MRADIINILSLCENFQILYFKPLLKSRISVANKTMEMVTTLCKKSYGFIPFLMNYTVCTTKKCYMSLRKSISGNDNLQ